MGTNVDDQNDQNDNSESTVTAMCADTTQSIDQGTCTSCTTDTDLLSTSACVELNNSDQNHSYDHGDSIIAADVDLPHSDLTAEVHDDIQSIEDDRLSSTSGIVTTSACFRKEWSADTNSDAQSSSTVATGLLSRSGSYALSDSFNSCDRFSLLGDSTCTRSGAHVHVHGHVHGHGHRDGSPEGGSDAPHESLSGEEMVDERPSLSTTSLLRRKKTWDSGFYAASKIIMTRSKFADLRRIGDDFTISQALTSPFHDISSDSFGSRSPEDEEEEEEGEEEKKTAGHHQLGRSLSVSSIESTTSSVCSLLGEDSSSGR